MTTLSVIPPADQVRWHELLKSAPLVIILLYMRTRGDRSVTQSEIADNFQIERKTAARYLRKLANEGKITQQSHNDGYMLAEAGFEWLLIATSGWVKMTHPSLSLKDSRVKKKDLRKKERRMSQNLTSERILSETGRLFPGHRVTNHGLSDELQPDYVLAWLAQAYDGQKTGYLSWPWAFAYRNLKNHKLPEKKYQEDPLRYLPNEFLVVLDLAEPQVIDGEAEDDPDQDIVSILETTVTIDAEIYQAWESVLRELQKEMPKASFQTWVDGTIPIGYEDGRLTVAAHNGYAADWLNSRLQLHSTAQRLLSGILGEDVQVEFVVW